MDQMIMYGYHYKYSIMTKNLVDSLENGLKANKILNYLEYIFVLMLKIQENFLEE